MKLTTTFHGPPTQRAQATTYKRAHQVKELVQATRREMERLDNIEDIDSNSTPGKVVVGSTETSGLSFAPHVASKEAKHFTHLRGEAQSGPESSLEVTLRANYASPTHVSLRETPTETQYLLGNFGSPEISVVEDKATGALTYGQAEPFPWVLDRVSTELLQETSFGPQGAPDLNSLAPYSEGRGLIKKVEEKISDLKALDNGPSDLNPAPGVVVVAGYGEVRSDNWFTKPISRTRDGGKIIEQHIIPTEAYLAYDPVSGVASEMSEGFGESSILSYSRSADGVESFANQASSKVERKPDGSMTVRSYKTARQAELDEARKQREEFVADYKGTGGYEGRSLYKWLFS